MLLLINTCTLNFNASNPISTVHYNEGALVQVGAFDCYQNVKSQVNKQLGSHPDMRTVEVDWMLEFYVLGSKI